MMVGFLVLAITLGSLLAAGLPLLTAVHRRRHRHRRPAGRSPASFEVSETAPILATMLGLAVGIDYALFILTRYRQNLHDGMEGREAAAQATATAGSAVVFAGATVVIALVGLLVVNIPFLTVMGLAAAGTVAIAVLIALTLLPALLGFAGASPGPRQPRVVNWRPRRRAESADTMSIRWATLVTRRPLGRRGRDLGAARHDRDPGHAHEARPAGRRLAARPTRPSARRTTCSTRGLRPRLQRPADRRRRRAEPARRRAGAASRTPSPRACRSSPASPPCREPVAERGRRPHGRHGHPDQRPDHREETRDLVDARCATRPTRSTAATGIDGLRHRPDGGQHRHGRPPEPRRCRCTSRSSSAWRWSC